MPRAAYNLTEDTFYTRLSPTSFYPLMAGYKRYANPHTHSQSVLSLSSFDFESRVE